MTDVQLFAVGFLLVVGIGLIAASRAIHRINLAATITARYTAARKVQAAYLYATPPVFRAGPFDTHTHTPGTCSFGQSCALIQRDTEAATRRAAL